LIASWAWPTSREAGGSTLRTMMFSLPSSRICSSCSAEAPSPMLSMQITAATPKITPSAVSSERSL
jgi:hypothetical protein